MIQMPTLLEMLKSGVHFGHQASKRYPKMEKYVHATRNLIDIINLEKTAVQLKEAMDFVEQTVANGGTVLFVSSKKQAKAIIQKYAVECGMPFVTARWLGGTFTNYANISKMVKKLKDLEARQLAGELEKYTKKEQLEFAKEIARLSELVGGMKEMNRLPEAMFVLDIKKEKTAVAEALKKEVPIIAMLDTNVNPERIAYPIAANDDATKSIDLISSCMAQAVMAGKEARLAKVN